MSNEQISFDEVLFISKSYDDGIYCLYNGEYGNHSLQDINMTQKQIGTVLRHQEESYKKYIGKQFGDYLCEKIEYDWGKHKQVWTVKCLLCGMQTTKENGYQWSRGKTGSMLCSCRKKLKKEKLRIEKQKREDEKNRMLNELSNEVGKLYGNFEVISCSGLTDGKCIVKCIKCGSERKNAGIIKLRKGILPHCDCERVNYNRPEWVGIRYGHCVSIGMDGGRVRLKCDCGRERIVNPSLYFRSHMYSDCGSPDCKYANEIYKKIRGRRDSGEKYELRVESLLIENGYKTSRIGRTGDYGVDIIAERNDGLKIAVQCKCNKQSNIGVSAVQEVYAGGRYYGMSHFAIVASGNVTAQAIRMARKLGVYISDGMSFDYPDDIKKYAEELIPTINVQGNIKARKLYEFKGEQKTLKEWAYLYQTSENNIKKGMECGLSFETALFYRPKRKEFVIDGISGNLTELCKHFGVVSPQTAHYRIERGMSIKDAVLTPKRQEGRPLKK